jgi:predicted choloylglycine hydrolase
MEGSGENFQRWLLLFCFVLFSFLFFSLRHCLFSGKAKAIGVSNYTKAHLEELLKVCEIRPSVNQVCGMFTPTQ